MNTYVNFRSITFDREIYYLGYGATISLMMPYEYHKTANWDLVLWYVKLNAVHHEMSVVAPMKIMEVNPGIYCPAVTTSWDNAKL